MAEKTIKWTESLVAKTFGLNEVHHVTAKLADWLLIDTSDLTEEESLFLEQQRNWLNENVKFWAEEDLKMNFLALLLHRVHYFSSTYRSFFDKEITAKIGAQKIRCKPDMMIASGFGDILEHPYFCFHEYKRKRKNADDPVAQVLLAMLIAQEVNQNDKPIYGCIVDGDLWEFMILEQKEYVTSKVFQATNIEDLKAIFLILKKFKLILEQDLIMK